MASSGFGSFLKLCLCRSSEDPIGSSGAIKHVSSLISLGGEGTEGYKERYTIWKGATGNVLEKEVQLISGPRDGDVMSLEPKKVHRSV